MIGSRHVFRHISWTPHRIAQQMICKLDAVKKSICDGANGCIGLAIVLAIQNKQTKTHLYQRTQARAASCVFAYKASKTVQMTSANGFVHISFNEWHSGISLTWHFLIVKNIGSVNLYEEKKEKIVQFFFRIFFGWTQIVWVDGQPLTSDRFLALSHCLFYLVNSKIKAAKLDGFTSILFRAKFIQLGRNTANDGTIKYEKRLTFAYKIKPAAFIFITLNMIDLSHLDSHTKLLPVPTVFFLCVTSSSSLFISTLKQSHSSTLSHLRSSTTNARVTNKLFMLNSVLTETYG